MRRRYITPSFIEVQMELDGFICQSYGTTGIEGRVNEFDAPATRRGWDEYENQHID